MADYYSVAKMPEKVMQLVRETFLHKLQPDQSTYVSLIRNCANSGDSKTAHALFSAMLSEGFTVKVWILSLVLSACEKSRDTLTAEKVCREVTRIGVALDFSEISVRLSRLVMFGMDSKVCDDLLKLSP